MTDVSNSSEAVNLPVFKEAARRLTLGQCSEGLVSGPTVAFSASATVLIHDLMCDELNFSLYVQICVYVCIIWLQIKLKTEENVETNFSRNDVID